MRIPCTPAKPHSPSTSCCPEQTGSKEGLAQSSPAPLMKQMACGRPTSPSRVVAFRHKFPDPVWRDSDFVASVARESENDVSEVERVDLSRRPRPRCCRRGPLVSSGRGLMPAPHRELGSGTVPAQLIRSPWEAQGLPRFPIWSLGGV